MEKINVLLLGTDESFRKLVLPAQIELECTSSYEDEERRESYELVILDKTPTSLECELLHRVTKAHTLFVSDRVDREQCREYCVSKQAQFLQAGQIPAFLQQEARWFFRDAYGEKYACTQLSVSRNFSGEIQWEGSYALKLTGSFGEDFGQAAFWRNNIPLEEGQTLDFWLEYAKTPGVEISLHAVLFALGSLDEVLDSWQFSEKDMENIVQISARKKGFLFVSVFAKGSGSLEIIALHDRYSRGRFGTLLPGGERYVTAQREEIFCYFDPGDCKPPLNVYFSGYKTREGFEAYRIMRQMGAPFLLVSDSRLEGGGFYVGSPEYEALMVSVLRGYLDRLGFDAKDMILSGISMGSTGALYYGCDLQPHAILVGKPLANLGTIAANERLVRPGGFPTSLDLLLTREGELSGEAVRRLDARFWQKFEQADWSHTKLIASYMMEDDYDRDAYEQMVQALSTQEACIYGRGLHGRHNDNTGGIVQWFVSQYHKILREDFAEYSSVFRQEIMK